MPHEIIEFDLFGLHLQEPMSLITSWMMCAFSIYAYFKLTNTTQKEVYFWKAFFFWFFFSTFFGGTGHLFFKYSGIYGKFPNWIATVISGYYAGVAMTVNIKNNQKKKNYELLLVFKSVTLLVLALATQKFLYVATDAILTYSIYCGILGWAFYKTGDLRMIYFFYGVIVCLPSVFIFFLNVNPHLWFNKVDLSHIFLLACISLFFIGAKKLMVAGRNNKILR